MTRRIDPELLSLKRIAREFETFTERKQCERVIDWLTDRYLTHWEKRPQGSRSLDSDQPAP